MMNNKICISLYVPIIEQTYDLFIPKNKRLKNIIIIINMTINQMTNGYFPLHDNLYFIEKRTGQVYDIDLTVQENGILNNSEIVLM